MRYIARQSLIIAGLIVGAASMLSCAGTGQLSSLDAVGRAPADSESLSLADDHETVHTVQLHQVGEETSMPIYLMGSETPLRLAFDLVEAARGLVTVYFYHADREWNRDLSAGQYMDSFHRDQILDFESSFGTMLPYVHYEYSFPNRSIDFTVSGNYVLRVSGPGGENDVLFERVFYVTEQATQTATRIDEVFLRGQVLSGLQPSIEFEPPRSTTGTFDFTVCFVSNHQVDRPRCTSRPVLDRQPNLLFQLDPSYSFERNVPDYVLDLRTLRRDSRIASFSQVTQPWEVELEPDFARFPGELNSVTDLNGRSVIADGGNGFREAATSAEYVATTFRFEPINRSRHSGLVSIVGSFSDWRLTPEGELTWNAETGRYEGKLLIKQGLHEYRYIIEDDELRRAVETAGPNRELRITSFVYYKDFSRQTDRLVAVASVRNR